MRLRRMYAWWHRPLCDMIWRCRMATRMQRIWWNCRNWYVPAPNPMCNSDSVWSLVCSWSVSHPIWFACVCRMWRPAAKWWEWPQWPSDMAPFRSIFVDKNQIQYLLCTECRMLRSPRTTQSIEWSLCCCDWTRTVSLAACTVLSSFQTLSAAMEQTNVMPERTYYFSHETLNMQLTRCTKALT